MAMHGMNTSTVRVKCRDRYGESSFLSKFFWCWLEPLFITGCRRYFHHEDLCDVPVHACSETVQKKLKVYWEEELARRYVGREPRLWVAIVKMLYPKLLVFSFLALFEFLVLLGQAILVGLLADYFLGELTEVDTRNALLYATGVVICSILSSILHHHAFIKGQEAGMLGRIALTGTIYKKIFTLSLETIGETTIGRIINLASNDVQRIEAGFLYSPFILIDPLLVMAVLAILWVYLGLGPSSLAGVGLMVLLVPVLYFLGIIYAKLRFASAKYTDQRVKVMNEVISGIRVIKMYGWEYAFKKLIVRIRRKESRLILLAGLIRGGLLSIKHTIQGVALFLMLATFTLSTEQPLTPSIVFTSLLLLNTLRFGAVAYLIECILGIQESRVALFRIQKLLTKDLEPANDTTNIEEAGCSSLSVNDSSRTGTGGIHRHTMSARALPYICVDNLSAMWNGRCENDLNSLTLKNISFSCDMNKRILAIVGPVGAGKSSLLHCLLGELQPVSGSVEIEGSIGFSSQESWVFSGTVRENVLFGQEFEEEWYNQVLSECCLKEDMSALPFGDLTLVGERGVTLSGGQKARITLARAVYRKANVYFLDDPLSAVDAAVGQRLFRTCMSGALKNSIVVLVTHHLRYAQLADAMLVLDKGEVLGHGTYNEIMNMISHSDETNELSRMKTVLSEMIATTTTELEQRVFDIEDIEEWLEVDTTSSHKVPADTHTDYSNSTSTTAQTSAAVVDGSLELVSFTQVEATQSTNQEIERGGKEANKDGNLFHNTIPSEDKAHGSVTLKTYIKYFKAGGGYIGCFITLVVYILGEASITVNHWWASEWAESNGTCASANSTNILCDFSNNVIVLIYFGITCGSILLSLTRGFLFFYVCLQASHVLHNRMFGSVLRAPVRFFDTNPTGRILNRFSKDLGFLDDRLPFIFFDYLTVLLRIFSILIVAGVANHYIFIPVVIVVGVFVAIRWYYLTTAREIKRLEAIARSPLFSHISATLQGLTTIRACHRQDASVAYFHAYQDEQTKGWNTYINASRWLGLRVDLISSVFITVVVFLSIPLASGVDAGLVGLSITYSLSLTTLCQFAVKNSTEVESLMISTERLMAYGELQPEPPLETPPDREKPPSSWPSSGAIQLDKMNFRYSSNSPYVLTDVSVDILPREKIGIIGRTGAGKSSIVQALFRMAEPEGMLKIDGISITEVGLHDLRQRMSIISQDPVLFSGSVRYNLDPFSQYTDGEIWTALEQVQLKDTICEMDDQLGSPVSEGGANFSIGQRQLLCLGRALLRKNTILVIDEATANVDMSTDAIIQETIRREFSNCTTLTIAHRLDTIMDTDRIMVLSGGKVKEFNVPYLLLSNPHSLLYHMVEQTGESGSQRLKRIATESYLRKQESYMW